MLSSMPLYRLINLILLCVTNGFFTIAGTFLNSVVIVSLLKSGQLIRKGTCHFMLLVLSSLDLLVVIVGHPSVILSALPWSTHDNTSVHWSTGKEQGLTLYELGINFSNYIQGLAMFSLLTVTVDRYLALTRPIFHKVNVTKRRLLILSSSMQLFVVGLRVFRFVDGFKAIYYAGAYVIFPIVLAVLAAMNFRMAGVAAKAKRGGQTPNLKMATLKANQTCVLTVTCFFLCTTPFLVYVVLRTSSAADEDTLMLSRLWANTCLSVNSTANCIIFFWRSEILRKEAYKLLPCCQNS